MDKDIKTEPVMHHPCAPIVNELIYIMSNWPFGDEETIDSIFKRTDHSDLPTPLQSQISDKDEESVGDPVESSSKRKLSSWQ